MQISNVIEHLRNWWHQIGNQIEIGDLYIFGSAVYHDGELFDVASSDLDLVILIPNTKSNAIDRFNWLKGLAETKVNLELELVRLLKRRDSASPIVSLIPITETELHGDIHKSRVRNFFCSNSFVALHDASHIDGIPEAGSIPIDNDLIRQVLEFCQEIRNKYLAVSAIADHFPLEWTSSSDSMPKAVMRNAAQLANISLPHMESEERFDLKIGLEYMTQYVFRRRHDDPLYRQLYDWISLRRGGRGDKQKAEVLSHEMHLLMGEILFDLAVSALPNRSRVSHQELAPITSTSIPTSFFIGKDGLLRGSKGELLASLDEASLNMMWQTQPYFSIVIEELQRIGGELLELVATVDPVGRRARIKLLDRQRRMHKISHDIVNGFQVLIYYQLLLFPRDETRLDDMLLALNSYSLLCNDISSYAASSFGGFLEAYNESLIGGPISCNVTFGLPEGNLNAFLLKRVGASGADGIMRLAANNQSLLSVDQTLLAVHFVPLLVKGIVDRINLSGDVIKNKNEHVECACSLQDWDLGVI